MDPNPSRRPRAFPRRVPAAILALALASLPALAWAQTTDFSKVEIETVPVAEGVHMLVGRGGNIAVSSGPDGIILVDDQFAPLHDKIVAAVRAIRPEPIRFVLNTHWHGDHTGGNEALSGLGAAIVAHDNVRQRMSTEQFNRLFGRTTPPSPDACMFTSGDVCFIIDKQILAERQCRYQIGIT